MEEKYCFFRRTEKYKLNEIEIEVVLAYFHLLIAENDVAILFNLTCDEIDRIVNTFYETVELNVEDSRYIFIDKENNRTKYYSLETIILISTVTRNAEVKKFILWGMKTLRSSLINTYRYRPAEKIKLGGMSSDYTLPQNEKVNSTYIPANYSVIADVNSKLREKSEQQRIADTNALVMSKNIIVGGLSHED